MDLKQKIRDLSNHYFNDVIKYRRHIHENPELSFQEYQTAKYVRQILTDNNIVIDDSFGDNAVVGIIEGQNVGSNVGLRADMDALKIQEKTNFEFKSKNDGVMHACGHDVHTASLIGTALILNQIKDCIKGRIILIFQPAEELDPGGAKILIDKGIINKYNISKIIGQHVLPNTKTGNFGFTPGKAMAATNEIYIKFIGKGGHAALPEQRSETVVALTEFLTESKKIQNKYSNDEAPVIVAFGKIIANGAINIIPSEVSAEGTMRTFDENVRQNIKSELKNIAEEIAIENKCKFEILIKDGYPHLSNSVELTNKIIDLSKEFLSENQVEIADKRMTGEDFAYFSQLIPASYYRMGIAGKGLGTNPLHNDNFSVDEDSLKYSIALMAFLAINIMS
jgi:amidohydrolase